MKVVEPSFTIELPSSKEEAVGLLKSIEAAGRVCYKTEDFRLTDSDDSYKKFCANLIKRQHFSVIEHASMRVRIVTDRGVSHEIVRHRIATISQESSRYCRYDQNRFGNQISVIRPPGLEGVNEKIWLDHVQYSEKSYMELLANGVTPEIARSVLPTCLKTEIVMTANLREWRLIFQLRTSAVAHPQMRSLMIDGLNKAKELFPIIFDDIPT